MKRLSVEQLGQLIAGGEETIPEELAVYRDDPVGFAREILGVTLWSHQRTALEAIAKHRRVSWRSSHGVGKTETAAVAALWHTVTRPNALTIFTAPSHRQVKGVVFRSIRRLYRNAKVPLGGDLAEVPQHGLQYPDGRSLIGFSAGDAERFAGYHAPSVLLIIDEASGVEQEIFDAAKGVLTGDGRMMLIGNPTQVSGEFFDSHNRKSSLYHVLHTSAYDSPNVTGLEPAIPGLIDQLLIDEMSLDYGPESGVFAIRVKGEFPTESSDAVISLALIQAARERYDPKAFDNESPLVIGLDPAYMGDDESVAVARRGNAVMPPQVWRKLRGDELAERVTTLAMGLARKGERPVIRVDVIGIGASVYDHLRANKLLRVEPINVAHSATVETYYRLRDEAWFSLRDWLRNGGMLPPDQKLEGELGQPRYTVMRTTGRIQVEAKDQIRARLRRSPDRADALALSVLDPRKPVARLHDDDGRRFEQRWPEEREGMERRW